MCGHQAEEANSGLQQARADLEAGRYAEARDRLTTLTNSGRATPAIWDTLAAADLKLADSQAAVAAFGRSLSLQPRDHVALLGLGLLYWRIGSLDKARELYGKAISISPDDQDAVRDYGLLLVDAGHFQAAIPYLNTAKASHLDDFPVRAALVRAYTATKSTRDVEREAKELSLDRPDDLPLALQVARALKAAGYGEFASAFLRKASQAFPNSAPLHAERGQLLLDNDKFEDAAVEVGTAVRIEPESAPYALELGRVLLKWCHYSTAYDYLTAIKPRFGSLPEFQYEVAYAEYGQRLYDRALADATSLIRDHPQFADGEYLRGNCYWAMNDVKAAIDSYKRAISLDSHNASYYIGLATVLRASNSIDLASVNLQAAIRLDPADLGAKTELALCYEKQGKIESAQNLLEVVERDAPEDSRVHSLLSRVYYKQGKKDSAAREHVLAEQLRSRESSDVRQQLGEQHQP